MSFNKLVATVLLVSACLCMPSAAHALQMAPPATPTKKLTVHEMQRERLQLSLERSQQKIDALNAYIAEKQERLDSMSISASAFDEVVTTLQTKRINLMIELAGLDARQQKAEKITAGASPNVDAQNELVVMLQKLVDHAKLNVARAEKLHSSGEGSETQLVEAKKMQVEAQLKLAQLRAETSGKNAQPQFATQMLLEASLAKAERSAQLELVNDLLKKYVGQARSDIASLGDAQQEVESYTRSMGGDALKLKELEDLILQDEMKADF